MQVAGGRKRAGSDRERGHTQNVVGRGDRDCALHRFQDVRPCRGDGSGADVRHRVGGTTAGLSCCRGFERGAGWSASTRSRDTAASPDPPPTSLHPHPIASSRPSQIDGKTHTVDVDAGREPDVDDGRCVGRPGLPGRLLPSAVSRPVQEAVGAATTTAQREWTQLPVQFLEFRRNGLQARGAPG
jgi:hypothetical protein